MGAKMKITLKVKCAIRDDVNAGMTLKDAAAKHGVSYPSCYAHKEEMTEEALTRDLMIQFDKTAEIGRQLAAGKLRMVYENKQLFCIPVRRLG